MENRPLRAEKLVFEKLGDLIMDIQYLNRGTKLRVSLKNGFLDIYISPLEENSFSFHFQKFNGKLYRLDTYPGEKKAKKLPTYPFHFHNVSQDNVEESPFELGNSSIENLEKFLDFVSTFLLEDRLQ